MAKQFELTPFDESYMLYGNYIGVVYVLETQLNPEILRQAWMLLQKQFPAMATHYDQKSRRLIELDSPIEVDIRSEPGHFSDYVDDQHFDILRTLFVEEPDRKLAETSQAPMASLTYTSLSQGGSILGLSIAHVVTDAGGFHRLARQLADNYNAIVSGNEIPAPQFQRSLSTFNFGTNRSWEETKDALARQQLSVPFSVTGISGWFMKRLVAWGMNQILSNERYWVHFTPQQVAKLKDTVLAESSEDWISTNIALSAHFSNIMAEILLKSESEKVIQLGQLLDLRHRYFDDPDDLQKQFIGNAILIHSETPDSRDYSRANLARVFKQMTTKLNPEFITQRMDITYDCLNHGRTYPGLSSKTPMICVNNQTKMPVYDLDFAGVKPVQILPQDVGDNIMFFPANDGGADIYLRVYTNKKGYEILSKPEWQARIFDF